MKWLPVVLNVLATPKRRRNLMVLVKLLVIFIVIVAVFSVTFHYLMAWEGQDFTWFTGIYWTLTVMSTLGFGDITFASDAGRVFSVIVLLSGTVFMLVLLPFMFIQFFYVPWLDAQAAARAPRELPDGTSGHVVLTQLGAVEAAIVKLLKRSQIEYVLLVPDLDEALHLHDEGYRVMVGELDDPDTYRRARVADASLVVTSRPDTTNTNVAFTVREISERVPVVATASSPASVDILELAGCSQVLQLGQILGQSMARRVLGRDAKSHVIGQFGELLMAEAAVDGTPLVGRTLQDIKLRDHANVSVVGVWDRGNFQIAGANTLVTASSVLVLAGTREQLDTYDGLFCIYKMSDVPVVIIGGGRVGRATAAALSAEGTDYRIVERLPERVRDPQKYVVGDAAELEVLELAGINESSSVVITTHDDDMNVYLTIYCRRLRPDIQILGRANLERNVSTLHRAGADVVMSYATTGANIVYNLLKRTNILLLAEGLDAIRLPVPQSLAGRTLAESQVRQKTGCHIIAVIDADQFEVNPNASRPLPHGGELIIIGDIESEEQFLHQYGP
jgi:voltage-gated potassium channel